MDAVSTDRPDDNADAGKIRACLASVLSSNEMSDAPRLQDFLRYVVEEKLSGREDLIVGKAIAQSVYGRDIGRGQENDTSVRVDAGRLRKKLAAYYSEQGRSDAYRIDIPVGAYKPIFTRQTNLAAGFGKPGLRTYQMLSIIGLVAAGLAIALWLSGLGGSRVPDADPTRAETMPVGPGPDARLEMERQAMFDKSPVSLEAFDLTLQARALMFPPLDPVRRRSALDLFQRAIILDDSYFGAYAGAAQVLAFASFVSPPGEASEPLNQAMAMVDKAKAIDPTRPWVQSALAWVAFVNGDFDDALVYSDRATVLAPDDWLIMDMHSIMELLNGDFENALETAGRVRRDGDSTASVQRNVLALSNFHLGRFQNAIDAIEVLNASGGTSSPLTATYLIAALQASGEEDAARKLTAATQDAWPDYRAHAMLRRMYRHPEDAEKVIAELNNAGWPEK